MNTKIYFVISFLFLSIISCTQANDKQILTYFGGQIVNPKSDIVTLMKDDKIIKKIHLKEDNSFLTELDSITEGIYSFSHGSQNKGYEFQYIYLVPKDSLLIRLNTWDFDESLVFSGKGAEKNNFLITMYLQNEKDGNNFSESYNLNSVDFEQRIASMQAINLMIYNQFVNSGVEQSEQFKDLAYVAVNYPINRRKEIYPYVHKNRLQLDSFPKVSDNYYDFRKKNNLNNRQLITYAPYTNYVSSFLYSTALTKKENNPESNYTENILNAIIENITIEDFKNNLLRRAIYNDFRDAKTSCSFNKKALAIFNKYCTNQKDIDEINLLAEDCERIEAEKAIIDFEIATLDSSVTNIKKVIHKRKSVIYFWSPIMINSELLNKRVSRLQRQYPTLLFVGINMYPSENKSEILDKLDNQYFLPKDSEANNFLKSNEPRTILVDQHGIISNGFTYLTSPYLERQLTLLKEK